MRVLFTTQSASLGMFEALYRELDDRIGIERAGFVVAESWAYEKWLKGRPDFETAGHVLLKEWEVTGDRDGAADPAVLAAFERELGGEAGLFGAIVADRRLLMGKDCAYSQDYRRRFEDRELLRILQNGLERTARLFDEVRPDVLIGFICVTMLDYLAYLFARARGVRVLNLRPTRVGDQVAMYSTLNDPAPEFVAAYDRIRGDSSCDVERARAHLRRVREEHGRYEGVVSPSDRPVIGAASRRRGPVGTAVGAVRNYVSYREGAAAADNHVPNPLRALTFNGLVNPLRARAAAWLLSSEYVEPEDLEGRRYAFFPLHTEPEVSLLVYGRPFVNQIEVVRALAMSLPVDMMLVIKEHPWMVGKRHLDAYRKLLNIPRVRIARPGLDARQLILEADLVAVITGSIALEAAIHGRPVLTFGDCPYNLLPDSMVRRCDDLRRLPEILKQLLDRRANEGTALEAYVEAVMQTSVSLNLYSVLLGKKNVYADRSGAYAEEIGKLAGHVQRLLRPPAGAAPDPIPMDGRAAAW